MEAYFLLVVVLLTFDKVVTAHTSIIQIGFSRLQTQVYKHFPVMSSICISRTAHSDMMPCAKKLLMPSEREKVLGKLFL